MGRTEPSSGGRGGGPLAGGARVPVLVVPAAGRAAEPYRITRSFLTPPVASRSRGISARPLLVHPDPDGADVVAAPAIADFVGEAVVPDETGLRRIRHGSIGVEDHRSVGALRHRHDRQRVAIGVMVVNLAEYVCLRWSRSGAGRRAEAEGQDGATAKNTSGARAGEPGDHRQGPRRGRRDALVDLARVRDSAHDLVVICAVVDPLDPRRIGRTRPREGRQRKEGDDKGQCPTTARPSGVWADAGIEEPPSSSNEPHHDPFSAKHTSRSVERCQLNFGCTRLGQRSTWGSVPPVQRDPDGSLAGQCSS